MLALPWQLYLLLVEVLVSVSIALYWVDTDKVIQYGWKRFTFYGIWDAVSIGLLVWAGSASWQHFLLGGCYVWAIYTSARRSARKHVAHMASQTVSKNWSFAACVLIAMFQAYLIIGGAR